MDNEQFTPEEQALIERLGKAPQSALKPETFDAIRARMLEAMPSAPAAPLPVSGGLPILAAAAALVAVVVISVALIATRAAQIPAATELPAPTPALTSSPVPEATTTVPTTLPVIVATEATALPATDTPPTATSIPTVSATPTTPPILIIEGPVEAIDGSEITIYDIVIGVEPDDPLLTIIKVGDIIRIEAGIVPNEPGDFVAVELEIIDEDVAVNPQTGTSWRDDGSCANPPPPWAPANGWRRRCQGAGAPSNNNQGQGNQGQGNNGQGNQVHGNQGQVNNGQCNGPPENKPGGGNNGQGNNGQGNSGGRGNGN